MPRVTQQHLDARRRQILRAAARCFARNGFHATTMADILRESGLSAGAVYRYFTGKEALVVAIAAEVLETVETAFEAVVRADPLPLPHEVIGPVVRRVATVLSEDDGDAAGDGAGGAAGDEARQALPRLLLQVWGEALRDPRIVTLMREAFARLLADWVRLVTAYQEQGMMRPDVPPEHVARTLIATVQGHFVQQAVLGTFAPEDFESGLRAVTSMRHPDDWSG